MDCVYQCIKGRLQLLVDNCPAHNCPADGGPCNDPGSDIVVIACPPPFPPGI